MPTFVEPSSQVQLSIWKRIVTGGTQCKSRLHDEMGARVPLSRAIKNGPRALLSGLARLFLNIRPERPWISYDAQTLLARHLNADSSVLEFGSGMSTIWFGRHAGRVVSIESDAAWFELVGNRLRSLGNVEYHFADHRAGYVGSAPDSAYDLIVIDGQWRDDCAKFAMAHLAEGGMIYLDNSDKGDVTEATGDLPETRRMLIEFAERKGLSWREFTDFAPTQLFVQRGLMVGGR